MEYGIWFGFFIVFLLIELATQGLVSAWFSIGSLAAGIAALLGANIPIQILVFVATTTVVLILLKPLAARFLNKRDIKKTNVSAVIGKKGVVITEIDNLHGKGLIEIGSVQWTARSEDDTIIPVDSIVEVTQIKGVKAIVKLVK